MATFSERLNACICDYKAGEDSDLEEHFSSGHCAEFAMALVRLCALNERHDASISIIYREEKDEDGELFEKVLSHVVVYLDNNRFDIYGLDEDGASWEKRWDEDDKYGHAHDFVYQDLEGEAAIIYNNLEPICESWKVPLDMDEINIIAKSLQTFLK
ncbi:hypothetical protein [Vibrio phage vB_VmeM-Yong XC32]|nr:hypothetical protein [Vibrio phage vB_VmeM-Yong XC31]QAX96549.1 hypothetical protein [Vibrio phage vB_VmeM-Yong XC32]QAX96867.1 hypothetical protein [Vibrio phage vB_VmeM-Yong MS31]QAX97172.1 hypothetical protein [Vibrio phage vB_VmeM-Yong MS32]